MHSNDYQSRERNELLASAIFELSETIFITIAEENKSHEHAAITLLHMLSIDIHKELEALNNSHEGTPDAYRMKRIEQWLTGLSQYRMIPLPIHITLLKKLEPYLEIMSHDLRQLTLRAFKSGVLHLRSKAIHDTSYFPELTHIIAVTLSLSLKILQDELSLHLTPSETNTRQTFELARIALALAKVASPASSEADIHRLKQTLINHELLRRIDMFSLTRKQQSIVHKRIYKFISYADIHYIHKGKAFAVDPHQPYLMSHTHEPSKKPDWLPQLPQDHAKHDVLLLKAGSMLENINEMTRGVSIAEQLLYEVNDEHLEKDNSSFLLCAAIISNALKTHARKGTRQTPAANRMVHVRPAFTRTQGDYAASPESLSSEWLVTNESRHDLMMESKHQPFPVTSLLHIDFDDHTAFGMIRWYRYSLRGEVRSGVQLLTSTMIDADVRQLYSNHSHNRRWPALLEDTGHGWNVWLGNWHDILMPMTLGIKREQQAELICRVNPTRMIGKNYAVFALIEILHATDDANQPHTFSTDQAQRITQLPDIPEKQAQQ